MRGPTFHRTRVGLTSRLVAWFNADIFGSRLPRDLAVTWSAKLRTTAGLTHYKRRVVGLEHEYTARVELSTKVLDNYDKLRRTLAHEMCHVAAWLLDHVDKPPHGAVFKKWGALAQRRVADMEVSTCHAYEIHQPYKWECGTCGQDYGRHSKSIDVDRQRCGVCKGKLIYLGKSTVGGTPAKTRAPTQYQQFQKAKSGEVRARLGAGATLADVSREMARMWKEEKEKGRGGESAAP